MTQSDALEFRRAVLEHYRLEGRAFPWRQTADPWAILVSEIMLQQTQTLRVVPKYEAWMKIWPDAASLAVAPLASVYEAWSGLGYNSRAMRLRETARVLARDYGGLPPDDEAALMKLPGLGPYTARAVLAFAYGRPVSLIETNIRSALIFHFFPRAERVRDSELLPAVEATMDRADPRSWYYALMDYGAWLKKREPNPSRRSAAYARQGGFAGSTRQARGAALRALSALGRADLAGLSAHARMDSARIAEAAGCLVAEGILRYEDGAFSFSE